MAQLAGVDVKVGCDLAAESFLREPCLKCGGQGTKRVIGSKKHRDVIVVRAQCHGDGDGGKCLEVVEREFDRCSAYGRAERLIDALLLLVSGATYVVRDLLVAAHGDFHLSEASYYRMQGEVCQAIEAECDAIIAEERASIRGSGEKWEATLDGGWSHRGFRATHHCFVVLNHLTGRVVAVKVLSKSVAMRRRSGVETVFNGNYEGSSKGMEGAAFDAVLAELDDAGSLPSLTKICCDQDSTVARQIGEHPKMQHVDVVNDAGHSAKNFIKALGDVFGGAERYKGFRYRIARFWMRCIKRTEALVPAGNLDERVRMFTSLFRHGLDHYTRKFCPLACPCNQFVGSDNVVVDDDDGDDELVDFDGDVANVVVMELLGDDDDDDDDDDGDNVDNGDDGGSVHVGVTRVAVEAAAAAASAGPASAMAITDVSMDRGEYSDDTIVAEVVGDDAVPPGCRLYKRRRRPKHWLNPYNQRDKEKIDGIRPIIALYLTRSRTLLGGMTTCMAECAHSVRLRWLPKNKFFHRSYAARAKMAAALRNVTYRTFVERVARRLDVVVPPAAYAVLDRYDGKRERNSVRKRSKAFKIAQGEVSRRKIGRNSRSREEVEARWDYNPTYRPSQRRTQADLALLAQEGKAKQCSACGKYYIKQHKCTRRPVL